MANPIITQIEVDGVLYDISVQLSQTTGRSSTRAMSQRATTEHLENILGAFDTEGGSNLIDPQNFEAGYFSGDVGSNLVPETTSGAHIRTVDPIDVSGHSKVYVSTNFTDVTTGNHIAMYFLNSADKVLEMMSTQFVHVGADIVDFTIPEGAKYMHVWVSDVRKGVEASNLCISFSNTGYEAYGVLKVIKHLKLNKMPVDLIVQTTGSDVTKVMSQAAVTALVNSIADTITSKIPFDRKDVEPYYVNETVVTFPYTGYMLNYAGKLYANEFYAVSDFIDISDVAQIYRYGTTTKWNLYNYAFYDAEQNFLQLVGRTTDYSFETINGNSDATALNIADAPEGTKYIRIEKSISAREDVYTYQVVPALYTYTLSSANISTPQILELANSLANKIPFDSQSVVDGFDLEQDMPAFVHVGKGLADNGELYDASARSTTDYIDISNIAMIYRYGSAAKYSGPNYSLYDKNKKHIGFTQTGTDYEFETINGHPYSLAIRLNNASAKYIRLSAATTPTFTYKLVPRKKVYTLTDSDIVTPTISRLLTLLSYETPINELLLTEKKIVTMGDSIFGNNDTDTGVTNQIAKRLGATVINGAFGGTRMSVRESTTTGYDKFDFPSLVAAIISNDYSEQEAALTAYSLPSYYASRLENLKNLDWDSVTTITLNYGTNDYTGGVSMATYKTAMEDAISTFLTIYPHIRFIAISPTWRFWYVDGVYSDDSDTREYNIGTLPDVCNAMRDVATNILHIPFIDAYNIGINKFNYSHYFNSTDGTHQDTNGRILLAEYLSKQLVSI